MLAIILTLLLPIVLIYISKQYNKDRQVTKGEMILRYLVYLSILLFVSSIVLELMSDDNTSVFTKVNESLEFAVKFTGLQTIMAAGIAAAEWLFVKKRIVDKISDKISLQKLSENKVLGFLRKYICPFLIYVLAAFVICLNVSLMFDNVLWGDEAFSANTAAKDVDGILQVLYYWDNHPPLHYYWLKLFGEILGHTIPVYHLASLVPFMGGVVLAVTKFRKHFGNIPAAFFVVISGLGAACLEYNLEVRMYSLAFCGVLAAFYCSYRVISTGKRSAWVGMVLWALVAAYSHYYALAAAGILLFCTGVAVWLKYRGKTWLKGLGAIVAFLLGYAPWLFFLFTAMRNVSNNWWMTELLGLDKSLEMVMGGKGLNTFILPLLLLLIAVLLLAESSVFCVAEEDGQTTLQLHKPNVKQWSDETYSVIVGTFTIIGTIIFAYLLCFVMGPVLAERYLYPLSAVTFATLVVGTGRGLALLKKLGEHVRMTYLEGFGKVILVVMLACFVVIGLGNFESYSALVAEQESKTTATLELIGEPDEEVQMVTNGVKHLGWTVLYYYYPDNEIINGDFDYAESDRFWYFTPYELFDETIVYLNEKGYDVTEYGEMQLSQYPFQLYYMEKPEASKAEEAGADALSLR